MIEKRSHRTTNGEVRSVLEAINAYRDTLTVAEDRAATFLVHHYPAAGLGPMARLARAADVSPQTVMRLLAKLRIANWEEFQERLRTELAAEQASPLGRLAAYRPAASGQAEWLQDFGARLARNVAGTFAGLAPKDFEAAARLIADPKRRVVVIGGRFTQQLARLLVRHLQIVRGGVEEIGSLTATWPDRLIDVDRKTTAVVFDVRRYSSEIIRFAAAASKQGASVIAVTDALKAPVARHAAHTMVGRFGSVGAWDSITAHLAITEALVARVTELSGPRTTDRMSRIETLRDWIADEE